jgi:excisionase family DNA binding protein
MNTTELGLEPLIGVEELAEYLGVPVQTIYDWRLTGKAPRALKIGKHLRFALADVRDWLDAQREGEGHE